MKRIVLEPIRHKDSHTEALEAEIVAYFKDVVFDPIVQKFSAAKIRVNSGESALWSALMDGTVSYHQGRFTGTFSASISKELRAIGARRVGTRDFELAESDLPVALRGVIAHARHKREALHDEVLAFLIGVLAHVEQAPLGIPFTKTVDLVAKDVQLQFTESLAQAGGLTPTSMPEGTVERAAKPFRLGTEKAIRSYTLELADQLKSGIDGNRASGAGVDQLARVVEVRFGQAQRKARFLAANETSALVAHLARERFESIGSHSYVWETKGDAKVRPTHHESNDHRSLNRRVFRWDDPPVVDPATGRRANPGEDFNCRCVGRPVCILK